MTAPATCSFTLLFLNPITCCHSWHHLTPTSLPLPHHCTTTSLLLLCQKQKNSHSKTFSFYSNPHMPLLHPLSQKPQQHCCVGNPLRKQYAHTHRHSTHYYSHSYLLPCTEAMLWPGVWLAKFLANLFSPRLNSFKFIFGKVFPVCPVKCVFYWTLVRS